MKREPPKHLSKEASDIWRSMAEEYNIEDGQGVLLLNTLCEAHDQAQAARRILALDGYVTESDTTGYRRAHPAAAILKEARTSYFKALQMLQLDVEPAGSVGRPPGR